ncbi:O-Antigen ligase [Chitinophaga sp. CF118]|uniref:O-antigen ligase family protein n=1 Tax=Chitinophaga sp. CF118 TaxID=1884367 RepID=UPI0008DFA57E|nr:O-antigen ligase family protein [Chitinophaga sp. CF118]SFF06647.1 O-Antigen ligase [Chitinophaga sp. CF118]
MSNYKTYPLFLFVAIVYTFFNSVLLPEGLYYTTLLTPFFFINLIRQKYLKYYFHFLIISLLFACIQLPTVEYPKDYIVSFVLLQTLVMFVLNAYLFFKTAHATGNVFKSLATINIVLVLVALITLFIPFIRPVLWYLLPISPDIPIIPRLKLFTFEASYYSLVMFPIAGYYALKKILLKSEYNILFFTLCLSLLLSFSLGVMITSFIGIIFVLSLNMEKLKGRVNITFLMITCWGVLASLLVLFLFYRHNPLFGRLQNIYTGKDTSARGRITDSFYIAWNVTKTKSIWFGAGLGQFKHIGKEFSNYFYSYSKIPVTRVYNSVAETFCIYGALGVILRFYAIIYLFIKTKVWENYYRQLLFIFIFIYQFTGSYLFNPAEYVIWILAFSPALFPQFNRTNFILNTKQL